MAIPVVTVELGLGGRFRQRLINEPFVSGAWPLSEIASSRARDITDNMNHGTYTGTGFSRGVSIGLPEGGLGCSFDGNGYVLVPENEDATLSLSGGSIDIAFLIKTTTNDAISRPILHKYITPPDFATRNGWVVYLSGGQITWLLERVSSTVFNFTRGSIADGAWHLIHCYYDPPTNTARIYIDGVQSGASVTTVGSVEAPVTTVSLTIGGAVDEPNGFIGSLGYVMIGREGNPNLAADLQETRVWTDVSDDVEITEPIRLGGGIQGTSELDRTAGPGRCTFRLDNSDRNSVGMLSYYSIGHPHCRDGFTLNTPVRVSVLDPDSTGDPNVQFVGFIKKADPLAGESRDRYTAVTAVDWLEVPARQALSALAAQIGQPSHLVFWQLVDQCDWPPHAIEYYPGGETLAYALDSGSTQMRILQEMARVAASGQDYMYLRGDGTLVYEPRYLRRNETVADAEYDNTMLDVSAPTDQDAVVNIVRSEIVPREVDASATTVLFSQTNRQPIEPGDTLVIEGQYRDPDQPAARMGGTSVVPPIALTDYTMKTAVNVDITSDADVVFEDGGSGFRATITNNHATQIGYFRFDQIRGQGIRRYESILVEERDRDSERQHGPRELPLAMPYQTSVLLARDVARQILERRKDPRAEPSPLVLGGATQVRDCLERVIGDKVEILETVTGIDDSLQGSPLTPTGWYIQSKELLIEAGPVITATFGLTQAPSILGLALWIVGVPGFTEVGLTTWVAPL